MYPGDILEGRGLLLRHGRLIARVDYHLTIPPETHFFINPTGSLRLNYDDHLAGFILVAPTEADEISLTEYTLELINKNRKRIRVERRYKEIEHRGERRISFWVSVIIDR